MTDANTVVLKMFDITGENAVDRDTEGKDVYTEINRLLTDGKSVIVDCEGVRIITAAFLNYAVGHLLSTFKRDFLKLNLRFTNYPVWLPQTIRAVVDNAEVFYASKELEK